MYHWVIDWLINDEMEIKQKELIVAYFKMLSQNLFGGAKEKTLESG
jgi:hypothetical protein